MNNLANETVEPTYELPQGQPSLGFSVRCPDGYELWPSLTTGTITIGDPPTRSTCRKIGSAPSRAQRGDIIGQGTWDVALFDFASETNVTQSDVEIPHWALL